MRSKPTIQLFILLAFLSLIFSFATCKYSTKDTAPIPADIKTFRVNYFENKARYVNPQLTPQITESLKQKIIGQTRLRQTNDEGDYDISGYVSDYSVTTSGVANATAGTNRLNVTFHLILKDTRDPDPKKSFEADLTTNYDFSAGLALQQAEAQLLTKVVKNVTDAIFSRIFSNW